MGVELSMWQVTPLQLQYIMSSTDAEVSFIDACFADEDVDVDDSDHEETPPLDEGLYLDKIWHLVHYLITGDEDSGQYPLGHAVLGGYILHEPGEQTSFLPPDIVKDVAEALGDLSEADMRKLCNPDVTPKPHIYRYPFPIVEEDFDDALSFIHQLIEYYQEAAKNGNAMFRLFH